MELEEYKEVYNSLVLTEEADQRILEGIRQKGGKTMKKKYYKPLWRAGRIVAAVVAVIIAGTAVYAATEMWNNHVAKEMGVSDKPEIRDKMSEEGFSQYLGDDKTNFSVTDEDITISVIQTLADRYCATVYFEADFGNKYSAAGNNLYFNGVETGTGSVLPQVVFKCNGKVLDRSLLNGVSEIINNHKVAYRYNIGYIDREEFPDNAEISMEIDAFVAGREKGKGNQEVVVTGKWNLQWKLSIGTERRIYALDHPVRTMDMDFKLKEFDVSPLSFSILLEEDGWTQKERKEFKKLHKDNAGINFIMNGITMGYKTFLYGGMGHLNVYEDEEGRICIRQGSQFGKVLDMEKMTGISFRNNHIMEYLSLEDTSYTIVK